MARKESKSAQILKEAKLHVANAWDAYLSAYRQMEQAKAVYDAVLETCEKFEAMLGKPTKKSTAPTAGKKVREATKHASTVHQAAKLLANAIGASIADCEIALSESNGDEATAIDLLRARKQITEGSGQ